MAVTKRKLTDRDIRAMKPAPRGRRVEVWDALVPGLSLRVTDRGHKSLCLYAQFPGSPSRTPTRRAIGEHGRVLIEDARETARRWLALIDRGVDPEEEAERLRREERARQGTTFAVVAEEFIARHLRGKRKGADNARVIRRELIGPWGERPITEITRGDLIRVVEAVVDRPAPSQAHTVFAQARRIWNWALNRDYGLATSPCDRVDPTQLIGRRKPRERTLTDPELGAVWRASGRLGFPFGPLFRVLLLTGCRRSEVSGARWSEIDLDAKLWAIPAERYKTEKAHVVPLTADVLAELEKLPPRRDDLLFQTVGGPASGFSKAKARLDRHVAEELGAAPAPFTILDLRRTCRTRMAKLGVADVVAERVLGHVRGGIEGTYDQHDYEDEKRAALERWAAHVRGVASPPEPGSVVEFRKRGRRA